LEIHRKDKFIASKQEVLEINPYENFDDLEAELQFYVEETLKAIAVCEESEESSVYPVVIDHRTNI
jgi:hypothetical protein